MHAVLRVASNLHIIVVSSTEQRHQLNCSRCVLRCSRRSALSFLPMKENPGDLISVFFFFFIFLPPPSHVWKLDSFGPPQSTSRHKQVVAPRWNVRQLSYRSLLSVKLEMQLLLSASLMFAHLVRKLTL